MLPNAPIPGQHQSLRGRVFHPLTNWLGSNYLNSRLRRKIARLKRNEPHLKIGETHCHSLYSDGNATVRDILHRAASIGLDFVMITEHLMPGKYPLENCLRSIGESRRVVEEWRLTDHAPIRAIPAIEVSTREGHLIVAFDERHATAEGLRDIRLGFSPYNHEMPGMLEAAEQARLMGGVSIIAHPEIRRSYPFGVSIDFALRHLTGAVDAIEDVSTGHGFETRHSQTLGMAAIGSSDDHFNLFIGTAVTGYDSLDHRDPVSAIRARATRALKLDRSLDRPLRAARSIF